MKESVKKLTGRRSFLTATAGTLGAAFWADETLDAALQNTRTASRPSDLKITDLRMAAVGGGLIRLDTNQGIYGVGENRDGARNEYVLSLKRLVVGENPCNIDKVFRKIKQFGGPARQGGGVSGIEMALWDLAGKAYNVPVYQMLGGKFRDRIRIYCDTPGAADEKTFKERMKLRIADGFTFFKVDVGINLIQKVPGTVVYPPGADISGSTVHMFTGAEITDKGIALMADYMARVREAVGWELPIATDHFGHVGVNSCIRLGKAFEKYNLAWMEDFIPWQYTDLWKKITDAIETPTLTGEDIYLKEGFIELARNHAVDMLQPDLATSGGILETHKIGDAIQEYGVPMVMHMATSPVSCFANVHCAAATENFLVLENHAVDRPQWQDIVDGVEKPIVNKGYIKVPDGPGLGFTLNEEAIKKQLRAPGYFEPTPQWDLPQRGNDRLWS
ncbi:MAG: mandelate racemase/muconate lactonizing enzyme family protein [Acidobacteria bacterium]|nr:mandelate racemase/muconate lactonizing enzyme family protein [Acidobacteriota bacterium]